MNVWQMQLDYRNSPQFRGYMKVGVENTGGITDFKEQLDLGPEDAEDIDIIGMST
jgi:isopenicillin N synthase-like dioxygenase